MGDRDPHPSEARIGAETFQSPRCERKLGQIGLAIYTAGNLVR